MIHFALGNIERFNGLKRQITESWNGWGWKEPLEIICFTPLLLKQSHWNSVAQVAVQAAFEHLQGWKLSNLFGKPVQCSVTHTLKKYFLMFRFINTLELEFWYPSPLKHQGKNWEAGFTVSLSPSSVINQAVSEDILRQDTAVTFFTSLGLH